ncbi:hypothetical protein M5K25_009499 [Dendrobium thyrsiflorum]|uniref:UDP-rhamnose:rhamnosyltransferase 1 n=1 Tax=Dendrobium thyrsiflorum TaxID=117978 RepID=A0ABD0V5S3_DENTH
MQGQGSTVYVAFGSEVKLSEGDCRRPGNEWAAFRLGIKGWVGACWLMESIKVHGRGLVCVDWVPQVRILSHSSIGGFLTQAGCSSVVEGFAFGLAMVLLPMVVDQGLIARKLVEKGIGVEVPRKEDGSFTGDDIAKSLRFVMVEDEGKVFRAKAKECKDLFGDEELHDFYVSESIQHLKRGSLHILMLPWFAFGHLLPFLELAKSIARKGHRISFLTTPKNAARLPAIPPPLTPFINFIEIPLPKIEHLPENAEATIDLPSADLRPYLSKAFDTFEQKLSDLIQTKQISSLDCILFDYAAHWVPTIAIKFSVPCAFFSIFNASSLSFFGPPSAQMGGAGAWTRAEELTLLPTWIPFPSTIVFRSFEAHQMFNATIPDASGVSEMYRAGKSILGSQIVLIRSCKELEPEWLQLLGHLYGKPVIPVGLLPPSIEQGWHASLDWLDKQGQGSTVYVAFGSEVKLSVAQVKEIAVGLELSGLHFVWALRARSMPVGLMESIKVHGRGLVCIDWVPQVRILAHPSIGGFLTHAGCSSVVEGLAFGLVMVLLPMIIDQGLIARKLVEKEIGVEVPRKEDGSFTGVEIAKCLRFAMVEDEGKVLRAKAKECRDMFGDEELHDFYVSESIQHLKRLVEVDLSSTHKKSEKFTLLPSWIYFPSTIIFCSFEARQIFNGAVPDASAISEAYRLAKSIQGCQIVLIHSCKELEPQPLQLVSHLYKKSEFYHPQLNKDSTRRLIGYKSKEMAQLCMFPSEVK